MELCGSALLLHRDALGEEKLTHRTSGRISGSLDQLLNVCGFPQEGIMRIMS